MPRSCNHAYNRSEWSMCPHCNRPELDNEDMDRIRRMVQQEIELARGEIRDQVIEEFLNEIGAGTEPFINLRGVEYARVSEDRQVIHESALRDILRDSALRDGANAFPYEADYRQPADTNQTAYQPLDRSLYYWGDTPLDEVLMMDDGSEMTTTDLLTPRKKKPKPKEESATTRSRFDRIRRGK